MFVNTMEYPDVFLGIPTELAHAGSEESYNVQLIQHAFSSI